MIYQNEYFIFDQPYKDDVKYRIDGIKNWCKSIVFRSRMRNINDEANKTKKKYDVSICAIFKNEAPYLKEWIEFNHLIGIDHFYLYDNNSDDDYMRILKPYVERGLVTLNMWPRNHEQINCYLDCIDLYKNETKWMGFIDIDEFIVPKSTDNIYDFLQQFENRGAVKIYWRMFGTSGKIRRNSKGLVTEDFYVCWPRYSDEGKCFYNTSFSHNRHIKHINIMHHNFWTLWKNQEIPPVNIFGEFCFDKRNIAYEKDFPIQINHYFTKSYEEYLIKSSKGDVYFKKNPHDEDYFYYHEMKCTSSDYSAYRFLIKLKKQITSENI